MKKWTRILAVILALGMLLSLAGCGSKSADKVVRDLLDEDVNAIVQKNFSTPQEYYRAVEERRADELLNLFIGSTHMEDMSSDRFYFQNEMMLALDQSVLDQDLLNLIVSAVGVDTSWFKSISISSMMGRKDNLAELKSNILLNGTDIVHLDAVIDQNTLNYYVAVPEISDSYILINMMELLQSSYSSLSAAEISQLMSGSNFDAETLKNLVNRYYKLVLDNINQVTVIDGAVSAGGVSCTCTVANVRIEGQDLLNIAKAVLTAANNDAEVEDLVYKIMRLSNEYSGSAAEFHSVYQSEIQEAMEDLNDTAPEDIEVAVLMTVYIDGKGEILGRTAEILNEGERTALYSFLTARDGDKLGVDIQVGTYNSYTYSDNYHWETRNVVSVNGNGSYNGDGKLSGSFLLNYNRFEDWNGDKDEQNWQLALITANGTIAREGFIGEIVFTPTQQLISLLEDELRYAPESILNTLRNMSVALVNRSTENKVDASLVVRLSGRDLLTLSMTQSQAKSFDIALPTNTVDPNTWANSIGIASLNTIINNLTNAGVPSALLNGLLR